MPSDLFDYLTWRGDLSFTHSPLCPVDFLIFSELAHSPLENLETAVTRQGYTLRALTPHIYPEALPADADELHTSRFRLWMAAAGCPRFSEVKLAGWSSRFDAEEVRQFAAAFFLAGDTGIVAFRGTDATLVGWHEDLNLSFETPVPAQEDALAFLTEAAKMAPRLYVCGHSKGGNLAMYAAARASADVRNRVLGVYNFDGPGLDDATLTCEGMADLNSRTYTFVPEASIIGKLLGYQEKYTVIRSESESIMQHNPFYWHVLGPGFETAEETSLGSQFTDRTLRTFLGGCSKEKRQTLVGALFKVLTASGAMYIKDVAGGIARNADKVAVAIREIPPENRAEILEGVWILLGAICGSLPALVTGLLHKWNSEK